MSSFEQTCLDNGINLFVHPTGKFKTILVQLIFHRHLNEDDVTPTSLFPSVLQRGCGRYPTRQLLAHKLEELYGSEMTAEVLKKGERQLVSFTLDLVHDQYLPAEKDLLRKGLMILQDVVADPVLEGGGFKSEYVKQEKEQHEKVIRGLINDKIAYAMERCLQEMCAGEPFGIFKYGTLERLQQVNSSELYDYYRRFLLESPADLHIIGDVKPIDVAVMVQETFQFDRRPANNIPDTLVSDKVDSVRYVREELDINQGKLVLGFRTGLTYADEDYFPLLVYNGILGGFPHSKLFQNVREKASLAYYAYSRLEKHKGLMVVSAGIEVKQYEQTLEIIRQQFDSISRGDFDSDELENTRNGLRNQFLVEEDNPALLVNRALDGVLSGRRDNTEGLLARLDAVTREDVCRVAEKVKLDTVYFLTQREGAQV